MHNAKWTEFASSWRISSCLKFLQYLRSVVNAKKDGEKTSIADEVEIDLADEVSSRITSMEQMFLFCYLI